MLLRSSRRSFTVLLAIACALLLGTLVGQATTLARQDDGQWAEWEGVPGPEECTAESVEVDTFVDGLLAAAATPPAGDIPLQVATIDDLPAGEPASDEETDGALTTVRELIACVNAGKFGSVLALFTPEGLVQLLFGSAGLDPATLTEADIAATVVIFGPFLTAPATPVAEDARSGLTEITDVRKLPDDRILVVSVGEATGTEGEVFAVLEEVDGRWLIDAAGAIGEIAMPTAES